MVIISKTVIREFIREFIRKYPDIENALEKWYDDTKAADWKDFSEVKERLTQLIASAMTDMFSILMGIIIV